MNDGEPLLAFEAAVRGARIELDVAALAMARLAYPALDAGAHLVRLDALADEARESVDLSAGPWGVANAVSEALFERAGFGGNAGEYYDPRNSYLNDVLDRKLGIPITLALLYMEVGRRLGLEVHGIGMPGHFLARLTHDGEHVIVDCFNRGTVMDVEDCALLLARASGGGSDFDAAYLQPVSKRDLLARMLNNLQSIYLQSREFGLARDVMDRVLVLHPDDFDARRVRGLLRDHLGDAPGAIADLEAYLKAAPGADDSGAIFERLARLRREGTVPQE